MSEEKEKYSVKDELKEEAGFFGKRLVLGGIDSLGKLGRGAINVFREHPKVEKLEDEVQEHIEELKDSEDESK